MCSFYTILEHPADIGIEARGVNLIEAFKQSAIALISIILDMSNLDLIEKKDIKIIALDYEQLLVKWLNEILYLYDGDNFIPVNINIKNLSPTFLEAEVQGEKFNPQKHHTKMDVKAITYHQILVQEKENDCLVRVYLDI